MAKQRQGLYEGMYILSATLGEESRKKALERITQGIEEQGGELLKIFDWGRRRLAYSIQKKKEGHYYVLYFRLPSSGVIELWKDYPLHEDLLRFSTMTVDQAPESLEFQPLKMAGA